MGSELSHMPLTYSRKQSSDAHLASRATKMVERPKIRRKDENANNVRASARLTPKCLAHC